jgi:hypothetical protein
VLKIIKIGIELKKVWPLKIEGSKKSKNKTPNAIKVGSKTPTKFLVCCFVVVRIQDNL